MRWTTLVLAVCTAGLYYASEINQRTDISLDLIELETSYGIEFWIPLAVLTVLSAVFNRMGKEPRKQVPEFTKNKRGSDQNPAPAFEHDTPTKSSQVSDVESLGKEIMEAIKNTALPVGAQIKYDFDDRYPLQLKIERCTPEMTRSALKSFAHLVQRTPTPPQIMILFVDVISSGIPFNTQVSGAFRKHFHTENLMVRGYEDQVEVRFLLPDKIWST